MVCELNIKLLRGTSITAIIFNILTITGLIVSNVVDVNYFANSGTASSLVGNNVKLYNLSIFSMAGLNFVIRYILAPLYFLAIIILLSSLIKSYKCPCAMTKRRFRSLAQIVTVWQFAVFVMHLFVISVAIDIMRTFVSNPAFISILEPWVGAFPWHFLVLLLAILPFAGLIMMIVMCIHYRKYSRCITIKNKLLAGLAQQPVVVDVPDTPLAEKKTRVIKVEAEAPMDMDGKVRVLLKEKADGAFEIITEEQFQELNIEQDGQPHKDNAAFTTC